MVLEAAGDLAGGGAGHDGAGRISGYTIAERWCNLCAFCGLREPHLSATIRIFAEKVRAPRDECRHER